MTKRTRLFVVIAAGILVAGLGTGLLASYMNIQTLTLIGGNGPEEFAYVPADAQMLGFANVRAVMDSEVRRKLMELHPGADNADRFQERTGINITQDIDSVVAAVTPDVTAAQGPPLVLPERPGSSGDARHAYALPGIFAEANFELIGARRPAPLYAHDAVANRAGHPPFLDADGHRREIDFRGSIIARQLGCAILVGARREFPHL